MKIVRWAFLAIAAFCNNPLKTEVQTAFLEMDMDGDGIVTKAQIMQSMMKDVQSHKYIEGQVELIISAIESMVQLHDKNRNGFDFLEMYTASGGNLQDL